MILGVNGRFLSSRQTGVQRFASEIVRRLWPRIETGVLLLPRATIAPHGLPRSVTSVSGRLSGQGWEQVELPRAAGAAGCDVVLNPANTLPVAGGPHVVVVHDVEPLTHPGLFSPAFAAWYRWALAPAVRRAARVVTVSRASAAAIADAVGVDPACIRIVDQGAAPFDTPANPAAVEAVRARYGFTGSYLLTVGGHDPRKNVRFLREVLALWRGRADADGAAPAPLLVVVSGGDGRIFSSRSVQKGAKPGELDVGRVDDATLHALYTGAAAFVFPSLSEGFGRPPLEALACGAPVMTSPYLASVEVLGNAADRVPLRAEAWVDGLMRVMGEGPREVAARRKRGIDRVASHSWEAGAAAVIAACREAAGDRVRPGPAAPAGATSRSWAAEVGPRSEPSPALGPPSALTPIHRLAGLRVAIVHDWLTGMRGGERVLESLLALFPQAELFTLLHRPGGVSPTIEARPIHTSLVQRLPGSARHYRWYLPLFPRAIESFAFEGFDLVVSSSHCVAKSAMTDGIPHLCYCHTPMRYAWDQFGAYFGSSAAPFRLAAQAATHALRRWDRTSADRVHRFVANSTHVRDRIRTAYGRDATVVYPPVDVDRFTPAATREDFYLVVSALVPYKRVDLAVAGLGRLGRTLLVVGSGPELPRLRSLAGRHVQFTGWLPDEEVAELMGRCRAVLMPGVEDFGLVPVEAQAAGAPVIALGRGGVLESVLPSEAGRSGTGVFFPEPTQAALEDAIGRFERLEFNAEALRASAERFRPERFREGIVDEVEKLLVSEERPLAGQGGLKDRRGTSRNGSWLPSRY